MTSHVYGYDLKENDDIVETSVQLGNMVFRLALPGAALVNYLPFRGNPLDNRRPEEELTIPRQCDISLRGSLGSAISRRFKWAGTLAVGRWTNLSISSKMPWYVVMTCEVSAVQCVLRLSREMAPQHFRWPVKIFWRWRV